MDRKHWVFIVIFGIVLISGLASADGGVVSDTTQRIFEPSQKAAIFWKDGNETLILSTKIRTENATNMAWLIPVPSKTKPEVESSDIGIFWSLSGLFAERWEGVGWGEIGALICLGIPLALGILLLISAILVRKRRRLFIILLVLAIIFLFFLLIFGFMFFYLGSLSPGGVGSGVELLEIKKVDIYDVAVLKATNATALVKWLNGNGYAVPESATSIIQEYCDKENFYFVVNKINLTNKYNTSNGMEAAKAQLREGVATPLNITFQPEKPFYPLKISSINEGYTEIDVYVISKRRVADSSGILREYASISSAPGEYSNYNVTLLRYRGDLKLLNNDSTFIEET
jgi:hypothetical protein